VEPQRQDDPGDAPGDGLAEPHAVRLAMEDPEVEREQREDDADEGGIEPPVLAEREEQRRAHHGIRLADGLTARVDAGDRLALSWSIAPPCSRERVRPLAAWNQPQEVSIRTGRGPPATGSCCHDRLDGQPDQE